MEDIYKNIDSLTEAGLETGKKLLEQYQTNAYSKEKYIADVTQKLNQQIEMREVSEMKMLLGNLHSASKDELIKRREDLRKANFRVASTRETLDELTGLIDNYEVNQRTVDGITYETQDVADAVKAEKAMCESIVDKVDSENEQSILGTIEELRALQTKFVDSNIYIHKVDSIYAKYKQEKLMYSVQGVLKQGEFKAAMDMINNSEFTGKDREFLILVTSEIVKNDYADKIRIGKKYKPQQQSISNLLLGGVGLVIIGYILSNWIEAAFIVSIILAVLGIIGNFIPDKDDAEKKEAYDFVQTLITCGYIID